MIIEFGNKRTSILKKARLITFLIGLFITQSLFAQITLPAIISSNMVLQRNTTVKIWGWANSNETIVLHASWAEDAIKSKTDKNGKWQIDIVTTNSKEHQWIKINAKSSKNEVYLENILFGEVWLCSGQSNMQQPVKGYNGQPTFGSMEAIMNAKNQNLRFFTVGRVGAETPQDDLEKHTPWQEASSSSVADFSAVAYFFGMQLQKTLDVPVGLIHTSWGASAVQSWMSDESLKEYQIVDFTGLDAVKKGNKVPTALFNAMLSPLIPYTIKGAIWYQGEANRKEPEKYQSLFPAMVSDWRQRWGIGNFPFYFAQIAPFTYQNNQAISSEQNSAYMRQAQQDCVDLIPNSGIAITTDLGNPLFIHPPRKKEVANRLLYNALNQTYGIKAIDGKSPRFDSLIVKNQSILLYFKNAETGLFASGELSEFEIAGDDRVFHPATAIIVKRMQVLVSNENVPNPVAVRYAWRNYVQGSLYDTNLLPASSFRTDDWDNSTRVSE
ncbi:MAG: sialate O-acetylesterase [Cyclobacteriaceae bacterium]